MSPPPAPPALVDVRRGSGLDVIELVDEHGAVVLLRAWGVNADEARRTRERAFALLLPLVERPS